MASATGKKGEKRMATAPKNVARGLSTRERIFDASVDVFGRRGYRAATLAGIAQQSGVRQSAILHHFATKEALLLATLGRFYDGDGTVRTRDGEGLGEADTFDFLDAIVTTNLQRDRLVRFYAVISGECLTEGHPAQEFFRARNRRARANIARALAADRDQRRARDISANSVDYAALLIGALDGLQVQWLLDEEFDMAGVFTRLTRRLSKESSST